jgi:hypothetical protein
MTTARRVSDLLRVDRLDTGDRRLVRDLVIDLGVDVGLGTEYRCFTMSASGATTIVTVPEGFETDFSSIPALARPLYRFDSVDLAGCCHDLAYRIGIPRDTADRVWRIVATSGDRHVGKTRGWMGWASLRLFASFAYNPTGDPATRHA